MIIFDRIRFTYPNAERPALRDVSLSFNEGELTLLVGPSGSGKSTLLRLINGLVPHFSGGILQGRVRVNNLDPISGTPQEMSQHVGFVFQDPEAQFVVDRVEDEIAFALENMGMPEAEMRIRVEEVLDLLDLSNLRDRPLEHLSGGEQQRVAIASALALRPSILVLDEPTSQLDPKSAEDVLTTLVRLNSDLGLTIVLAEHRLERVLPFADRVVYLPNPEDVPIPDGALCPEKPIIEGTPRDVLQQIDLGSPLVQLAKALDWQPLPLTIKEAIRFRNATVNDEQKATHENAEAGDSLPIGATNQETILSVQGLDFGYGQGEVLQNVSFTVCAGEMVALMGRNGSGKSTLLRCVMGLLQPKRGQIALHGQSTLAADVATIATSIGYLPQNPNALLFADTVYEELAITLRNHGREADSEQINSLLASLGIAALAEHYPRDLSVGQRQRVALAAVAIMHPQILLLDEPTRGLDHHAKASLVELLSRWNQAGMTTIIVTHDVEFAAMLADRVILLSQGEVVHDGSTHTLFGTSPLFATQVARLFPKTNWLTVQDVLSSNIPKGSLGA